VPSKLTPSGSRMIYTEATDDLPRVFPEESDQEEMKAHQERIEELEKSHDQLRRALIICGRELRRWKIGSRDERLLALLRRTLAEARVAREIVPVAGSGRTLEAVNADQPEDSDIEGVVGTAPPHSSFEKRGYPCTERSGVPAPTPLRPARRLRQY
jgi:hypothetical protein